MSLATFYENVAKEFGVTTPDMYDCTKINVAVNIYDQWYEQWAKETNIPDYELSTHLLMCGPKVDGDSRMTKLRFCRAFTRSKNKYFRRRRLSCRYEPFRSMFE